jgi:hypothetical protein
MGSEKASHEYSPSFDMEYLEDLNLDNRFDSWQSMREKIVNGVN